MKKFTAIFCSVLMMSSMSAYAGQNNYNVYYKPSNIKYFWCKPNKNKYQCTTTTQKVTEAVTESTTQTVSKPVEVTTQKVIEATTETTTAQTNVNTTDSELMAKQVLELVNKERSKNNLSPLKLNASLSNIAQLKSEDMKNKNYFDHTSPTYGSPFDMMKQFNISYKYAGENIAKGQKTAEAVVNAWMNSEGHRKNILNANFTDMGIGYIKSNGTTYWTQMFIQK